MTNPTETSIEAIVYHPDPEIDAEIRQQAIDAERSDLAIGYPPRRWVPLSRKDQGSRRLGSRQAASKQRMVGAEISVRLGIVAAIRQGRH
jgi:hypothetical protein